MSGSAGHPNSSEKDDDIVCTSWKHEAASNVAGKVVTYLIEHIRQLKLWFQILSLEL